MTPWSTSMYVVSKGSSEAEDLAGPLAEGRVQVAEAVVVPGDIDDLGLDREPERLGQIARQDLEGLLVPVHHRLEHRLGGLLGRGRPPRPEVLGDVEPHL